MQYAKYVSESEIILPTPSDYLEDGVTLKSLTEWTEYYASDKPTDESIFKTYEHKYVLSNDSSCIYETYTPIYFEPEGRVAKLDGSTLIFPSKNEYINGRLVCNYDKLPNSRKILDGWYLISETTCPSESGKSYKEIGTLIDDVLYGKVIQLGWEELPPVIEPPYYISKDKLRRVLEELGLLDSFITLIESDKKINFAFTQANVLRSDDNLVLHMIPYFCQNLNKTEEEVWNIMKQCEAE